MVGSTPRQQRSGATTW
ncbi:hypothetical protein BC938DRAFT_472291 [Jimgerdemannia flammicorona]|uniref:Uncharacterized protein n=1 Tax=Jimgerdemannia flammicorona TaxID=994334 RepID=A0A433Q6F3_9FUNG|nr:hypothetical protein BC938DRAFT_472291 [Jimgerdemannia flammicorona]